MPLGALSDWTNTVNTTWTDSATTSYLRFSNTSSNWYLSETQAQIVYQTWVNELYEPVTSASTFGNGVNNVYLTAEEVDGVYTKWLQIVYDNRGIKSIKEIKTMIERPELTDGEEFERQNVIKGRQYYQKYNNMCAYYKQNMAYEKAEKLLLEHLTEEQKEDYRKFGAFNVVSMSHKRYRIVAKTYIGNIKQIDDQGKVKAVYCYHLKGEFPVPDHLLAQKLMLECCEDEFFQVANRH